MDDDEAPDTQVEVITRTWPKDTKLKRNGGPPIISDSPPRMQPILTTAARFAVLDCMLEDAYADYPHQFQYLRSLMQDAALYHSDEVVAERVAEDETYFKIFKSFVSLYIICRLHS